jgi:hypothetical protein
MQEDEITVLEAALAEKASVCKHYSKHQSPTAVMSSVAAAFCRRQARQ